jgi:hypothetical protein
VVARLPYSDLYGRVLRTLRDAGEYIQALPRGKYKQPEWQIAAEMLQAAVEGSGPLMFAAQGSAGKPAPESTPRRKARR